MRERLDDVPLLVQHFIQVHGAGRHYHAAPETVQRMCQYQWPGNVRELENAVLRAIAMAGASDVLGEQHLLLAPAGLRAGVSTAQAANIRPENADTGAAPAAPAAPAAADGAAPGPCRPLREIVAGAERDYIKQVLAATGGNRTRAAAMLDISRKNLWEKMRDLELL